jgi:hypothetical protein
MTVAGTFFPYNFERRTTAYAVQATIDYQCAMIALGPSNIKFENDLYSTAMPAIRIIEK